MTHTLNIRHVLVDGPADGPWATHLSTGTATVTCACGLSSGTDPVPVAEAQLLFEEHRSVIPTR